MKSEKPLMLYKGDRGLVNTEALQKRYCAGTVALWLIQLTRGVRGSVWSGFKPSHGSVTARVKVSIT